jgi:tetratricopeptide (TPR) repeat protein
MKRVILALAAMVLLSSPAIYSQTMVRVDKAGLLRKIENSDKDIANPKRAERIATWLNRGKVFTDAATEISKNVYDGMPKVTADLMFGASTAEPVVVNGREFTKVTYPILVAYMDAGLEIRAWEINDVIHEGALEDAVAAYDKAYGLDTDKKNAKKINEGLQAVVNEYYKDGSNMYVLGQFDKASKSFEHAFMIYNNPGFTTPADKGQEKSLAYNTGLAYFNANNYEKAIEYFNKAESLGNELEGEIYYLIYHAYKKFANGDMEIIKQAESALDRGFAKYPDNANVVEVMTDYYVTLGKDPMELIPGIQQSIENDPNNPLLWNGLGRLYERLGDLEKSIEAFEHVATLLPDNYGTHYSIGVLYYLNGEKKLNEVNAVSYSSQAEYDKAKVVAFDEFRKTIAPLEKAYSLVPTDVRALELLKTVTFRLREDPVMAEKNAKYTELLNALKQ